MPKETPTNNMSRILGLEEVSSSLKSSLSASLRIHDEVCTFNFPRVFAVYAQQLISQVAPIHAVRSIAPSSSKH
jgi:hypothetical protein